MAILTILVSILADVSVLIILTRVVNVLAILAMTVNVFTTLEVIVELPAILAVVVKVLAILFSLYWHLFVQLLEIGAHTMQEHGAGRGDIIYCEKSTVKLCMFFRRIMNLNNLSKSTIYIVPPES